MNSQSDIHIPSIIPIGNENNTLKVMASFHSDSSSKVLYENKTELFRRKLNQIKSESCLGKENLEKDNENSVSIYKNSNDSVTLRGQKCELIKLKSNIMANNYIDERSPDRKLICKICYSSTEDGENKLISPCSCQGTMRYVHQFCLKQWILNKKQNTTPNIQCEICQSLFNFHVNFHNVFSQEKSKTLIKKLITDLFKFSLVATPFFVLIYLIVPRYINIT
jgi:hypothetical protein